MGGRIVQIIVGVIIGVIGAFYIGSIVDFFPFIADNYIVKAIGFCTLIICVVIAVCTCIIISNKKE